MNFLSQLFGKANSPDLKPFLAQGALVLDVRTPQEYRGGHVTGSANIPLDRLASSLKQLPGKDQPIITCCASGMRSASAEALLRQAGYTQVVNGGPWHQVQAQLER